MEFKTSGCLVLLDLTRVRDPRRLLDALSSEIQSDGVLPDRRRWIEDFNNL
jgi:hypothetical protein